MVSPILKSLFSSQTRVKLLATFLLNPEEEFFIRELTRLLDEQINSIRRELENMHAIGLVKARQKNRKKYYKVNPEFPFYNELQAMFAKEMQADSPLISGLKKLPSIDLIVLGGSFVGTNSKVDLLVVGDVSSQAIEMLLLQDDEVRSRNIKYSVFSRGDFLYRLSLGDRFIRDILDDPRHIVVHSTIQEEMEKAKLR